MPLKFCHALNVDRSKHSCSCASYCLQDLYVAWMQQGLDWIARHGQGHSQTPTAPALPTPKDLSLSPEQLQLITDYFCKVCCYNAIIIIILRHSRKHVTMCACCFVLPSAWKVYANVQLTCTEAYSVTAFCTCCCAGARGQSSCPQPALFSRGVRISTVCSMIYLPELPCERQHAQHFPVYAARSEGRRVCLPATCSAVV